MKTSLILSLLLVQIAKAAVVPSPTAAKAPPPRKAYLEDANFQTGSIYSQGLADTNANLNEMLSHTKRQNELKRIGQWFQDVEDKVEDYRENVMRKLNELHMALQRPKIPLHGGTEMAMANSIGGRAPSFARGSAVLGSVNTPQIDTKGDPSVVTLRGKKRQV